MDTEHCIHSFTQPASFHAAFSHWLLVFHTEEPLTITPAPNWTHSSVPMRTTKGCQDAGLLHRHSPKETTSSLRSQRSLSLTKGSRVLMSLILLPLRFKCVRLGVLSARTSRPPEILLSLSSSCQEGISHSHKGRQFAARGIKLP